MRLHSHQTTTDVNTTEFVHFQLNLRGTSNPSKVMAHFLANANLRSKTTSISEISTLNAFERCAIHVLITNVRTDGKSSVVD